MTRIHILGGSGYAGSHLVREAAARGHDVVSFSRTIPDNAPADVTYRAGDLLDDDVLASAFDDADVVVSALSAARGPLSDETTYRSLVRRAADLAAQRGVRLGIIGGAGSLLDAPGGQRLVDTPDFPDIAKPEALITAAVFDEIRTHEDPRLDWFFVSPAANFGSHAPGPRTGQYRIGGDIVLRDQDRRSELSGPDLALAVLDEIEKPAHHRQRFTIAY